MGLFSTFRKNDLIKNRRLISVLNTRLTSQPSQQIVTLHLLSNISRSKSNQTMKFGQLAEIQ